MNVTLTSEPESIEKKVEANVAPNVIRPDKEFTLGVNSKYNEKLKEVKEKQKADSSYMFLDTEFPPDDSSLVFKGAPPNGVVWKRPHQITKSPTLAKHGFSKLDVAQGMLGDCYFLVAATALATKPQLLKQIVPMDQQLAKSDSISDYAGLCRFRFWRFGNWVEITIDDNLPTMQGVMLMYGRSTDAEEFWVSLLEKAYAKIHGSYEALNGGQNTETLEDMTGGLAIQYKTADADKNTVFSHMIRGLRHDSFVCASLIAIGSDAKSVEDAGLVANHAYTVTAATRVKLTTGDSVKIIRLRNPWGTSREWTGAFSDKSGMWEKVDDVTRESLAVKVAGDGEFWMTLDDFWSKFTSITICTLGPDFDQDGDAFHLRWLMSTARGAWIPGSTAGGAVHHKTFHTNPQYLLHIMESDTPVEDLEEESNDTCHIQIGLMQEHRRVDKNTVLPTFGIGVSVFKLSASVKSKLDFDSIFRNPIAARNEAFVQARENCLTANLQPGYYLVIPATFNPNEASTFYLRIFSEKKIGFSELSA